MGSRCTTCFCAHATHCIHASALHKRTSQKGQRQCLQAGKFDSLLPQTSVNGKIKRKRCCLTFQLKRKRKSLKAIYLNDKHHLQEQQRVDQQTPFCKPSPSMPCGVPPTRAPAYTPILTHTQPTHSLTCKRNRLVGFLSFFKLSLESFKTKD